MEMILNIFHSVGFCTTTDLGLAFDHMNNVRHLREYDICRFRYLSQTHLLLEILKRGGNVVIAGVNIRYRLPIKTFSRYEVKNSLGNGFLILEVTFTSDLR